MRRDTQVVAGLAVFIIAVGVVAALVIANNEVATSVREPVWIRITPIDNNTEIIGSVYIYDENTHEAESFVYYKDGEWQSGQINYGINNVFTILVDLWGSDIFIKLDYKIGRGLLDVSIPNYVYIEIISYWEEPNL